MLFNAYTGGRLAEFVHASKGKASQDPLGEADEISKRERLLEVTGKDYDDESDAGDGPEYDGDELFDDDEQDPFDNCDPSDEDDSGYCTEETDDRMTEDSCPAVDVDDSGQPVEQNYDATELDEFKEAKRKYKALCYEDIRIWIVQSPKRGERDLLAMEVSLRHYKGVDNKPKQYHGLPLPGEPSPYLCPISHISTRAIRDGAILVDGYTSAEPFYTTDLPGQGMSAIKVRDAGFEDKLTSYCFRRGIANAVNGMQRVLRHDPSTGVFSAAYRDQLVRFNVQDAFLESNISDDGLTRAFTHMSIRCNPGAPKGVPEEVMNSLYAADPDIVELDRQFQEFRADIKHKYGLIKRAEIEDAYRKDYFFRIHNEMMKRQLKREQHLTTVEEDVKDVEPGIEHQLEERTQLQQVLCDLSIDLSPQEVVARKILAINLMIALASRQELQTHKPRSTRAPQPALKKITPEPPLQL
ncbi:hypothetical protein DL98DRAFT_553311 [Cadophora sp. DSE1049]|nr:hypothetical protein DL98DRAFT_553311 [Cadophora sp. DSE1049]